MLGRPHLHLHEISSTNDRARNLAAAGAPHGTVVSADIQTAGRGRQGRSWASPEGTLSLSVVIRTREPELLPLAAAVAVAETCGGAAQIKWPNDIWLGRGHKVAGILVETRQRGSDPWFVVGIGINASASLAALGQERAAALDVPAHD